MLPSPEALALTAAAAVAAVALSLLWIARRHWRRVAAIPVRIHVNGIRGKSTVTRLIAAGLRAGGVRTIAKTTGSAARLILEDGSEAGLTRGHSYNIWEQLEIIGFASERKAEALVIECMAVAPDLQWASEHSMVKSTCAVVTNVRPDHQEQMGETLPEIAWSLASVAPAKGVLVTAEPSDELVGAMAARAARVGARVVRADLAQAPTPEEFGRQEFPENLALALAVCELHGVERETALQGMRLAPPDPGALTVRPLVLGDASVRFVNAFAANDVVSTEQILAAVQAEGTGSGLYVVANARADRPRRTRDLAAILGGRWPLAGVFLIGDGADLLGHLTRRRKVQFPLTNLAGRSPDQVLLEMERSLPGAAVVVGIGNIGGSAAEVCERLARGGVAP